MERARSSLAPSGQPRTIPTRLHESAAWMRTHGDEPMRSHPMLPALLDKAAEEFERRAGQQSSGLEVKGAEHG